MSNLVDEIGIPAIIVALLYIGRQLQVLDNLVTTTDKIKANVKVIGDHLTTESTNFNPRELQGYSPLQLTADGKKLIKELGFDNVFSAHKDDFCSIIDGESPKLKYDVEKAAIRSVLSLSNSKEYMDFLKVFFYNHPDRNLGNIAPTLGIYVRDKYLERHPEITQ